MKRKFGIMMIVSMACLLALGCSKSEESDLDTEGDSKPKPQQPGDPQDKIDTATQAEDTGWKPGFDSDTYIEPVDTGTPEDTATNTPEDTATEIDTDSANDSGTEWETDTEEPPCAHGEHPGCYGNDVWCHDQDDMPVDRLTICFGGEQCVAGEGATAACECVPDWSEVCYNDDPWVFDSCDQYEHIIDMCTDSEECWVNGEGEAACCSPNHHTACVDDGANGMIHMFDSCERQGLHVETCEGNFNCTDDGAAAASCTCRNQWSGEDCTVCSDNWDDTTDCSECRNHWQDSNDNCGTCPFNWDDSNDCNSCSNGFDPSTECTECLPGWSGLDCATQASCVRYVNAASTAEYPNGRSWATAYTDLQDALAELRNEAGVENPCAIWIAEGTYKPTDGTNQYYSFGIPSHVSLYGGFPSNGEPTWGARDSQNHPVILSGEIGDDTTVEDNSHSVVAVSQKEAVVIDGCNIQKGYATYHNGGGLHLHNVENMTLRNVRFSQNSADYGGAVYAKLSTVSVENCTFEANVAESGAGMFVSSSNLVASGSTFSQNMHPEGYSGYFHGGAMHLVSSNSTIDNCSFSENGTGFGNGSAVYASGGAGDATTISNSNFSRNGGYSTIAHFGTGLSMRLIVADSEIVDNDGAALSTRSFATSIVGSELRNNGEGFHCQGSCVVLDTVIDNNGESGVSGNQGAIAVVGSKVSNNGSASVEQYGSYNDGSGIILRDSDLFLINSYMDGNKNNERGGAIQQICQGLDKNRDLVVQNSTIRGPHSIYNRGAIEVGCTDGLAEVSNSIIWDNTPEVLPGYSSVDCSIMDVTYSDVGGDCPGEGNLSADPLFVSGDVIGSTSPCIDAGNDTLAPAWDRGNRSRVDHVGTGNCIDPNDPADPACDWMSDMGSYELGGDVESNANSWCSHTVIWMSNSHLYWTCSAKLPWGVAAAYCQGMGGHLVQIDDQGENLWVRLMRSTIAGPSWLGARGDDTAQLWYWEMVTAAAALGYDNWAVGEPVVVDPDEGETCAAIDHSTGEWSGRNCRELLPFICESEIP